MKWEVTEKVRGIKNYTSADYIVKLAFANNMKVRGHNLLWHRMLPGWLNGLSKEELKEAMISRIK